MQDALRTFIERMGLEAERDGMPRISGRILAFLIASVEPASLDAMADALQVSRASVSTNCRLLEQLGAAERVSFPGDRKDYYVLTPSFPDRFFALTRNRSRQKVEIAEEALATLTPDQPVAREHMETWRDFHMFIGEELDRVAAAWKQRREAAREGQATAGQGRATTGQGQATAGQGKATAGQGHPTTGPGHVTSGRGEVAS